MNKDSYSDAKLADMLDDFDFEGLDVHPRVLGQLQGLMGLAAEALRERPTPEKSEAELACVDIYRDFAGSEIAGETASVHRAWVIGKRITNVKASSTATGERQ